VNWLPMWLRDKAYQTANAEAWSSKWRVFLVSRADKTKFRDGFIEGVLFGYNQTIRYKRTPPREEESSK